MFCSIAVIVGAIKTRRGAEGDGSLDSLSSLRQDEGSLAELL